jgi:hypothetical protein
MSIFFHAACLHSQRGQGVSRREQDVFIRVCLLAYPSVPYVPLRSHTGAATRAVTSSRSLAGQHDRSLSRRLPPVQSGYGEKG